MRRIEDIKEFEDIDTYYEISKIVEEVFQDRVEAHKHLVTANKEIKILNNRISAIENKLQQKENKLKEVREMVNKLKNEVLIEDTGNTTTGLLYAKPCCRERLNKIKEILDKEVN